MDIIETIKKELKNDKLFNILLPKIKHQIDNPDPVYGVISPMYSLMPCFFDYFETDTLSTENQHEIDRIVAIVDKAFGGDWYDLALKINQQREARTDEMIADLKHTKQLLQIIRS